MEKILHNTVVTGVKVLILCLGVLSFRLAGRADGQARTIGRLAGVAAVLSALLGLFNQRLMRVEHVFTTIAWGQKSPALALASDAALLVAVVAWAWLALTRLAPAEAGPALRRMFTVAAGAGLLVVVAFFLLETFA